MKYEKQINEEKENALNELEKKYNKEKSKIELAYELQKTLLDDGIDYFPRDIDGIMKDINKFWPMWDVPSIYKLLLDNYRNEDTQS